MQPEEIRRISERLDRLERQNRWLKAALAFVAAPLLVVSLGAASRMADDVTADNVITKGLHIKGEKGNRIFLGVNPETNNAVINVWDKDGKLVKALGEGQ